MDSAIRLYFDEGVQIAVAEQMRSRGIDAVTVRDLKLLGDADINHLQRASEMGRVICTFDHDFLRLHAEGIPHAGIVFARIFAAAPAAQGAQIERGGQIARPAARPAGSGENHGGYEPQLSLPPVPRAERVGAA